MNYLDQIYDEYFSTVENEFASPYMTPNFDQKLKPYQKFFKDLEVGDVFYESDIYEGPMAMSKVIKKHKPGLYDIEMIRCKYWEDANNPIIEKYRPDYSIFEDTVIEMEPYIQYLDRSTPKHSIKFRKGKSEWFGPTFEEYWADRKDRSAYVKFSSDEDFANPLIERAKKLQKKYDQNLMSQVPKKYMRMPFKLVQKWVNTDDSDSTLKMNYLNLLLNVLATQIPEDSLNYILDDPLSSEYSPW